MVSYTIKTTVVTATAALLLTLSTVSIGEEYKFKLKEGYINFFKYRPTNIDDDEKVYEYADLFESIRYDAVKDEFDKKELIDYTRNLLQDEIASIPNDVIYYMDSDIPFDKEYDFEKQEFSFLSSYNLGSVAGAMRVGTRYTKNGQVLFKFIRIQYLNGGQFTGIKVNQAEARNFKGRLQKILSDNKASARLFFQPKSARWIRHDNRSIRLVQSDLTKVVVYHSEDRKRIFTTLTAKKTHPATSPSKESGPIDYGPTSGPLTRNQVRIVQQRLTNDGFNPGVVDGIWGKKTTLALRKWQKSKGAHPTGEINEWERLVFFKQKR